MSNLLLEFNKKDLEVILKEEGIFTIAYEIELEADDSSAFGGEDGGYSLRELVPLSELVPDEHIQEKASELFYNTDVSEFYDYIGANPRNLGGLYIEWIFDQLGYKSGDWAIFQTADSLGLLPENIDSDLLEHMGEVILNNPYAELIRGNDDAWRAFAQLVLNNEDLKEYIEYLLNSSKNEPEDELEDEFNLEDTIVGNEDPSRIRIPDINQIDMFGEESKIDAVANLLKSKIPKEERNSFFGTVLIPAYRKEKTPQQIYIRDFIKYFAPYVDFENGGDFAEFDDNDVENMQQILRLFQDMNFQEIIEEIISTINAEAPPIDSIEDFENFELEVSIPPEYESDLHSWVEDQFAEFRSDTEDTLYDQIESNLSDYFDRDYYEEDYDVHYDSHDIENAVRVNFPNFYAKWGGELEFTTDASLTNGFEMFPSSYISTLDEGLQFLRDFYEDYDRQTVFAFSENTGLHTNVGIEGFSGKWNYFKGFLFTNDNFATRGFDQRLYNSFSQSLRKTIMRHVDSGSDVGDAKQNFRQAVQAVVEANFDKVEKIMNEIVNQFSNKHQGFSIRANRIEFRYPGGDVALDDMEAATLYYAYIVKLCTDPEFKKREYVRKAVAFMLGIQESLEHSDYKSLINLGDADVNLSRGMQKMKKAINDNPNPEPLFVTTSDVLSLGVRDLGVILEPGKILKDTSKILNFNKYEYRPEYPVYFVINEYNDKSKMANVTTFTYDVGNYDNSIAHIKPSETWRSTERVYTIQIIPKEKNVSLIKLMAAFEKNLIQIASSEDYAKLMIFQDPSKAEELLYRIYPWMDNLKKAIRISDGNNYFTEEEAIHIENGSYEEFVKIQQDAAERAGGTRLKGVLKAL